MTGFATRWASQFYAMLGDDRPSADKLREASLRSELTRWTALLTGIVERSFEQLSTGTGWRFPTAVCELESSADTGLVAYSLWKVLCTFVSSLARSVVEAMPIAGRAALEGETLIVVGSRNESSTFPYGFFQAWKLNSNMGRFERFARQ